MTFTWVGIVLTTALGGGRAAGRRRRHRRRPSRPQSILVSRGRVEPAQMREYLGHRLAGHSAHRSTQRYGASGVQRSSRPHQISARIAAGAKDRDPDFREARHHIPRSILTRQTTDRGVYGSVRWKIETGGGCRRTGPRRLHGRAIPRFSLERSPLRLNRNLVDFQPHPTLPHQGGGL